MALVRWFSILLLLLEINTKTHKKEEAAVGSSTGHRLSTGSTQALITLPTAPLF